MDSITFLDRCAASVRGWVDGKSIDQRLKRKVAARLIGICLVGWLTGFLAFVSPYWMASIWTALITIGLFIDTLRFIDRSERKLTEFLLALKQNDFTCTFSENTTSANYDLHRAFNLLNNVFRNLRLERESEHQILQVVVEHASAPMICFEDSNGEVSLINNAAKRLLKIPFLEKIGALARVNMELSRLLRSINPGEKKTFKLAQGGKVTFLSITSQNVHVQNKKLKLVALVDVTSELAAKEAESWHKLLRVLTHEISNSAIPLSTLSAYICDLAIESREQNRELNKEEREDILEGLRTIAQRSRSLKEFVQNFRNVGQIPEPRFERVAVGGIILEAVQLFAKDFENNNIKLQMTNIENTFIYADKNLTQQVFINVLKNAMEALSDIKDNKTIEIRTVNEGNRCINIIVHDTGIGISEEYLDQIFIPFYSTKKGGSGIGLSISQQIMQKQKGDIRVQSEAGKGSVFTLSFVC